ncbi:MAG TPA: response regulator, partial [Bacteroidales bacterium]|nr:response regulator [Bacteroidales bacterium]
LEVIFERFVQADQSLTRVHEGSGLGLAITKAYVGMLGGSIRVESKEGSGSTFRFTLPWKRITAEPPVNAGMQAVVPVSPLACLTILVAEDDEVNFTYLNMILSRSCKSVLRAINGIEAVRLHKEGKGIDIILMDIKMPGMDGYEATRLIRQFDQEVIIIAQTAHASKGEREKVLEAGCNDYITKPFNPDQLIEIILRNLK